MDNADVISQLASLQRRRALLDALTKQNMETQITGNTGLGQALLKVGNSVLQAYGGNKLGQEETAARQAYGGQLKNEAQKFLDTTEGSPGVDLPSVGMTNVGGVKANPKAAIINAMASQLPEIQAIGKAGFAGLNKHPEQLTAKDLLGLAGYDPQSKVAAALARDPSLLKGDAETVTVGDQVFNKRDFGSGPLVDARMTYGTPIKLPSSGGGYDLYQPEARPGGKLLKLDNAPKVNVATSVVNKGEDAFANTLGKGTAESILEARKDAQAGYKAKGVVAQLQNLEQKGIFNTPAPNAAIALGQFSQALGIPVDRAKLANSEAFRQQVAKNVSDVILMGSAARSMTDADREAFEKTLPSMLLSPEGRAQVYSIMNNSADAAIARHQSMMNELKQNPTYKNSPGMLTFNPVDQTPAPGALPGQPSPIPGTPSSPTGGPISLEEYIRQKTGGR